MSKLSSIIGISAGLIVIILAIIVFSTKVAVGEAAIDTKMSYVQLSDIEAPESESNEYYGGDAYTGIQHAAAQTANNLIPIFDAIEDNNGAIRTLNGNLILQNTNLESLTEAQAENLTAVAALIKTCFGYLLLAIGLLTIAKHLGALLSSKSPASY